MKSIGWAALAASSVLAVGCTEGERAGNNGECPDGEVCSDATPDGLDFIGSDLAGSVLTDVGPTTTAIGGTQRVRIELHDPDPAGDGAHHVPFATPFAADTSGPALSVANTTPPLVNVRGESAGSAYLRIIDADTDELFDRKSIPVAAVTTAAVIPATFEPETSSPIAFLAGVSIVGVALYAGTDTRLVDESMTLTMEGSERVGWDRLRVGPTAFGQVPLTVTAGDHAPIALTVPVVANVDVVAPASDAPQTVTVDQSTTVCWVANAGSAVVLGLDWYFEVNHVATDPADLLDGCVTVLVHTPGSIVVSAMAGGVTGTVTLPVVETAGARTAPRVPRANDSRFGERASRR